MADYYKPRNNRGKDLKGKWEVSIKIDGVRAFYSAAHGHWVSRNNKRLYGTDRLFSLFHTDIELFDTDWNTSVSMARSEDGVRQFKPEDVYTLSPTIDKRLHLGVYENPTHEMLEMLMEETVKKGFEGIVVRNIANPELGLKYKPVLSFDVAVTDYVEGKGKHDGRLGKFITHMGGVGTGFSDAQRDSFWTVREEIVEGKLIIEVECMEVTKDGKFRHPRFKGFRFDKDKEDTYSIGEGGSD
jgi:ATP-dependent DNA ligase